MLIVSKAVAWTLFNELVRFEDVSAELYTGESRQSSPGSDENTVDCVGIVCRVASVFGWPSVQHLPMGLDSKWEKLSPSWHQKEALAVLKVSNR